MPVLIKQQDLDIPDKETAIKRLDMLQENILRLRDDIPGMQATAKMIRRYLEGLFDDVSSAIALIDRLIAHQEGWQQWLAGRLTLLANLKEYLMQANNELEEDGA
jgi:hypothetical protein